MIMNFCGGIWNITAISRSAQLGISHVPQTSEFTFVLAEIVLGDIWYLIES